MNKLTYEKVIQLFDYDFETGNLMWKRQDDKPKSWNSRYGGKVAGTYTNTGYSQWLGGFYSLELAIKARKEAEEEYFGEFAYKGVK